MMARACFILNEVKDPHRLRWSQCLASVLHASIVRSFVVSATQDDNARRNALYNLMVERWALSACPP
jgi:hypothetical protein